MALVEKHTTYAPLLLISRGNMQFRNHLSEVRQGIVLLIPIAYRHSSVEKQQSLEIVAGTVKIFGAASWKKRSNVVKH